MFELGGWLTCREAGSHLWNLLCSTCEKLIGLPLLEMPVCQLFVTYRTLAFGLFSPENVSKPVETFSELILGTPARIWPQTHGVGLQRGEVGEGVSLFLCCLSALFAFLTT